MGLLVQDQIDFCVAFSALINFSPRVIGAWCLAEDSGSAAVSKAASGDNNWLNVEAFDSGWSAFATNKEVWANPTRAAQATWSWINTKADPTGLRAVLLAARGKGDAAELAAIINSTWTGNSHYGGGGLIHSTYGELAGFKFPPVTGQNKTTTQGGGTRTSTKETRTLPYEFSRGTSEDPNEDSWDCIERLASEVKWHAWMRNGKLWYASDTWLAEQPPKYLIDEFARGIDDLTFNVDTRGQTDDCTFHCEARRYALGPGDCVLLQNEGPANGPWIVYDVTRDAGTATAEVKIRRPSPPLPEPAPATQSKTITTNTSPNTGGKTTTNSGSAGNPKGFQSLLYWCNQVSSAKTIYLYAGGHVADENENTVNTRFDCSGAVCFVLFKAGFLPANGSVASSGLESWGLPGAGKFFTVWCCAGHTFIEFKQGTIFRRFDTVPGTGHPATGPRLWTGMSPEPISGEGEWFQRHAHGY
jgi:hypothetical protein